MAVEKKDTPLFLSVFAIKARLCPAGLLRAASLSWSSQEASKQSSRRVQLHGKTDNKRA